MTYLGDYLGQLLAEISMARMQADLETVRLAELYAMHPLLRTMPVPHVRLPDVDLEIPVLIKASEEPPAGGSTRGGASLKAMGSKFQEVLAAHLTKSGVTLTSAQRKALQGAVNERLSVHGLPTETSIDVHRIADDLTATALRVLKEITPPPAEAEGPVATRGAAELKDTTRLEFLKLRTPPPRLTVLVTSAEIREAGTADNLTRLRLKVSEQGLEWTTIESDGVQHDRLVPE